MGKQVFTPLYRQLKERCSAAGISLSEACRRANVDRDKIERWKHKVPSSFETLERIEGVLEEIESKPNLGE